VALRMEMKDRKNEKGKFIRKVFQTRNVEGAKKREKE
jgi:hypothetical protein